MSTASVESKRPKVIVTGSSGLVGSALRRGLVSAGYDVAGCDLRGIGADEGDVRDAAHMQRLLADCVGVVHLAAISRVVWAERDPEACVATNVGGLENILAAIHGLDAPPWLLFASSREVYGHVDSLPADEDTPLRPINTYGRSKVAGENLINGAAAAGLRASIVRLSNVYGDADDHHDRVIPAFLRASLEGKELRVEGGGNTFDFVYLDDVVDGLMRLIERLDRDGPIPPTVQLVTGTATTLRRLADMCIALGSDDASWVECTPREFDVSVFEGRADRAYKVLGWKAQVSLQGGLERLKLALLR